MVSNISGGREFVLLLLLSIPMCNAYVEGAFSIIDCYWRNERNRGSVNVTKTNIAVKMNCKYTCKKFCTFVLKEKDILDAAVKK
jgi:hypothetical protein